MYLYNITNIRVSYFGLERLQYEIKYHITNSVLNVLLIDVDRDFNKVI